MGIPFFFKNLVRTHGNVVTGASLHKTCDRLFLDFNCIIHQSANEVVPKNPLASYDKLESLIFDDIIGNIVKLINVTFPKQLLYIAIDGTCPRSKMTQQRKRRYISAWKNEQIQNFRKQNGLTSTLWDSNIITPGTQFMKRLDDKLHEFVEKNKNKLGFDIILSGSNEPGEGEHKIMKYIKSNHKEYAYKDVIYGLDADLIMLSLVSPNYENILLLREKPEFNVHVKNHDSFLMLNIAELSKSIDICYQIEAFRDDYVMLCALLGNDFIPPLSYLKIKENGIDILVNAYKKVSAYLDQRFITTDGLNYIFLQELLNEIGRDEDVHMDECCSAYYNKIVRVEKTNQHKQPIDNLMFELDNYPIRNKFKHKIDPSHSGWRLQYYYYLFDTSNNTKIVDICNNYIQGIIWVYHYYFTNHASFSWYYKYCYSPSILDIINTLTTNPIEQQEIISQEDKHREDLENNYIQLLLVLPPHSVQLLPKCLRSMMTNIETRKKWRKVI